MADTALPETERKWVIEAFEAAMHRSVLALKTQVFNMDPAQSPGDQGHLIIAIGTAADIQLPESESVHAQIVHGSFILPRSTLQSLVDQLGKDFGIRAQS